MSFWMASFSTETLLPSWNNQVFAYGVATLDVEFETKGFKWSRN